MPRPFASLAHHGGFAVLVAWCAAAFAFAWARIPFDDELFSLGLAREPDSATFWRMLAEDMHPPWTALLDRALFHLIPSPGLLLVPRLLASALALHLITRILRDRFCAPAPVLLLAAFHPIVFMYGVCWRWYPFLLLGQALRVWAMFQDGARPRWRGAAFFAGTIVGAAAGYIDVIFWTVDAICYWLGARRKALAIVLGSGVAAGLVHIASMWLLAPGLVLAYAGSSHLTVPWAWLGLGPLGEALPRTPFFALPFVLGLPGLVWAFGLAIRRTGHYGRWLAMTALAWLAATQFGVWHPRYSLLLWVTALASTVLLWGGRWWTRAAASATWAISALVLALTLGQNNFLKGDLNQMPAAMCASLDPAAQLVVAPYRKTAIELRRICGLGARVAEVPSVREAHEADQQMAGLSSRLAGPVIVVLVPAGGSSLETTNRRVHALLASRCDPGPVAEQVEDPFYRLKRALRSGSARWRFRVERWTCRSVGDR